MVQHQQCRSQRRATHHRRRSNNDTPTGDSHRSRPSPNDGGHPSGLIPSSIAAVPTVATKVVSPSSLVSAAIDPTAKQTQLTWPHPRLSAVASVNGSPTVHQSIASPDADPASTHRSSYRGSPISRFLLMM
jgi:hypothetical protein